MVNCKLIFYNIFNILINFISRLMKEPQNLDEMQAAMRLYNTLVDESKVFDDVFPFITDQLITLDKYKVDVSEETRNLEKEIPAEWAKYLEILKEAEKLLSYSKVLLREMGKC